MDAGQSALDLRLIVITDARLAAPRTLEEVVVAALQAGAPAIQLRDKNASPEQLHRQALRLREITRRYGALLFINDRLDIALAADADGVHLGPDDLPVRAARRAAHRAAHPPTHRSAHRAGTEPGDGAPASSGQRFLIGFSTDDPAVARSAEAEGADYIGCGAVFGTSSKPGLGSERLGTDHLAEVVRAVRIPVVAIGGITPANASAVAAAGAAGAAVIGAVMSAADITAAVRSLLEPFARE